MAMKPINDLSPTKRAQLAAVYIQERSALLDAFPELHHDTDALIDTLDGLSDAQDMVRAMVRCSKEDEAAGDALGELIDEYKKRQDRLKHRAEKYREAALHLMQAMDERTIRAPEFTVSVRAVPPKLDVYEETLIPSEYFDKVVVHKLARARLKDALDAGEQIPGARKTNGSETLAVRV